MAQLNYHFLKFIMSQSETYYRKTNNILSLCMNVKKELRLSGLILYKLNLRIKCTS